MPMPMAVSWRRDERSIINTTKTRRRLTAHFTLILWSVVRGVQSPTFQQAAPNNSGKLWNRLHCNTFIRFFIWITDKFTEITNQPFQFKGKTSRSEEVNQSPWNKAAVCSVSRISAASKRGIKTVQSHWNSLTEIHDIHFFTFCWEEFAFNIQITCWAKYHQKYGTVERNEVDLVLKMGDKMWLKGPNTRQNLCWRFY